MNTNIVYTYYEEIPQINNDPRRKSTQQELIDICKTSWEHNGWEFRVLTHQDAKSHAMYKVYDQAIGSLPSINPKLYDYHCYMRWLAMSSIGGLMIDYDVINIDVTPEALEAVIADIEPSKITVLQGHTPCTVYGSLWQYLSMCYHFMRLQDNKDCIQMFGDKKHTSDMHMIAYGLTEYVNKIYFVKNYTGSKITQGLVHCSQNSTAGSRTKKEIMQELIHNG